MNGRTNPSVSNPVFSGSCFLIAFGIINIFALTLLFSSVSFFASGRLTLFHLPLAIGVSFFMNWLVAKSQLKEYAWSVFTRTNAAIVAIFVISILFVKSFYDVSIDGQWYHQESVYQLAHGWNPFLGDFPDNTQRNGSFWFNHYSKGLEIFQASIYLLTGKIETGKASALILAIGSFFLCVYFLDGLKKFSKLKTIWISLLLAMSPLVVVQLLTFCNDGQMSSLLLYSLVTCCLVITEYRKSIRILLCAAIICAVNIKFTAILFMGCFSAVLLIFLFVKKRAVFTSVLPWILLAGFLGICFIGYNPYVTNYKNHGHPLYPLMGKNKVDIMTDEYPVSWRTTNRFQKLFHSLFTHTDDLNLKVDPDREVPLKIPFTLTKTDIHNSVNPQVTMAGFGALFSGIFLLFIVIWVLIIALAAKYSSSWGLRYMRTALYIAVSVNICFLVLSVRWNYVQTRELKSEFRKLKETGQVVPVDFNYYLSNRFRFAEQQIPYCEVDIHNRTDSNRFVSFNHSFVRYLVPGE